MITVSDLQQKIERLEEEVAALRVQNIPGEYSLTQIERDEVQKGLADRLATDEEVRAVFSKYGLSDRF